MKAMQLPRYLLTEAGASLTGEVVIEFDGGSGRFRIKRAPHVLLSLRVQEVMPTWTVLDACRASSFDLIIEYRLSDIEVRQLGACFTPLDLQYLVAPNRIVLVTSRPPLNDNSVPPK
jgi:hypothetical protein